MIANRPVERYSRRHHWVWILRQAMRNPGLLLGWGALFLFAGFLWTHGQSSAVQAAGGLYALIMLLVGAAFLVGVILDWSVRRIRLFSDGRLDYQSGVLSPKCLSLSMQFGMIRYVFHGRISAWQGCADLILPFGEGSIEDIADFRRFWELAQGRA